VTPQQLELAIAAGCDALGQSFDDQCLARFRDLLLELERWGRRVNLTAIRQLDGMVTHHLLDSLAVRPYLRGDRIVDIGTGAGFPGLPLAIAEPTRSFTLLDSNGKKIAFVRHAIAQLGLGNVEAVQARAEDYAPGHSFDTVIARALATIDKITELGGHLVGSRGVLLALKGRYPAAELERIDREHWGYHVDDVPVPGLDAQSRHIVSLERRAE